MPCCRMDVMVAGLVAALLWTGAARAADALVDAKRQAASDLMKQGKTNESIALLAEVVHADPGNYRDHLALARAYDKLNKGTDAASAYHRVIDLLAAGPTADRAAQQEAEKRLKVLEAQNAKVLAAEEEFLKKLETLEREAIAARDATAVRRVFRLKGGVYRAAERRDRFGCDVAADRAWQDTGFVVQAGRSYRLRAVGAFRVATGEDSTPDGVKTDSANGVAPLGMLLADVDGRGNYVKIGSSGRLQPQRTGKLYLLLNCTEPERAKSSGSATVLVEQE